MFDWLTTIGTIIAEPIKVPSCAGSTGLELWDFADPKLIAGFAVAVPRYLLSTALKVRWWLLAVGFNLFLRFSKTLSDNIRYTPHLIPQKRGFKFSISNETPADSSARPPR